MRDRLQLQRYEYKYVIPEETALAIRSFVSSYLDLDEYGATQPDLSYPVHSLYLDSDDLYTYQTTINGDKNRYKLRMRFYENNASSHVYCEIKRRCDKTISKQRAAIRREGVSEVLAGRLPDSSLILSSEPAHLFALERFCQLRNELNAFPKIHVSYRREAWLTRADNSVRVTLDRNVLSEPDPVGRLDSEMKNPLSVFGSEVVLELKFTGRFPLWFEELVRAVGIRQGSAAKYVDGVALLGESWVQSAGQSSEVMGKDGVMRPDYQKMLEQSEAKKTILRKIQ